MIWKIPIEKDMHDINQFCKSKLNMKNITSRDAT